MKEVHESRRQKWRFVLLLLPLPPVVVTEEKGAFPSSTRRDFYVLLCNDLLSSLTRQDFHVLFFRLKRKRSPFFVDPTRFL